MIAICSVDISEPVSAEVSCVEFIANDINISEPVSMEISIEEYAPQNIEFEDSDL